MTAPLSGQFLSEEQGNLATGMFGGPRTRIAPRGSYVVQGVGDPTMGYNGYGYYWGQYPAIVGGTSDYQAMSTVTGVPVGTPESDTGKNAGLDEAPTGTSVGGTAAY